MNASPIFWIIAGPNGSGKSSLYGSDVGAFYADTNIADFARSFWIINPDLLTARIRSVERRSLRDLNLEAVTRIEAWLETSIQAHQSVGVETVLSTDKYRRLVTAAKSLQFQVHLRYVILENVELCVDRVRQRIEKGGHRVPFNKVRERWTRSLQQLTWFLRQSDRAILFDNSHDLRVIGRKENEIITLDENAPLPLRQAIERIR